MGRIILLMFLYLFNTAIYANITFNTFKYIFTIFLFIIILVIYVEIETGGDFDDMLDRIWMIRVLFSPYFIHMFFGGLACNNFLIFNDGPILCNFNYWWN